MARRPTSLTVKRTERIGPHLVRVVATGPDLASFPDTAFTDRYVKILFPVPGVRYPEREVNELLSRWYGDVAALRRYLVDECLLSRTPDGVYWRTGGEVDTAPA